MKRHKWVWLGLVISVAGVGPWLGAATSSASAEPLKDGGVEAAAKPATVEPTWELIAEDEGVKAWRMEIEGSDVVAFRGETTMNAPIAKVASVLDDTSRKTEWVHNAIEAKNVKQISEWERIEYNRTKSPVPLFVNDRDFLFHAKVTLRLSEKQIVIDLKSVEDGAMPERDDAVRGHLLNSRYILSSLENDTKTRVQVEIHADPRGSLPKWMVNLFQKAWPSRTLRGIALQVAKPDLKDHEKVKLAFAAAGAAAQTVAPSQSSAVKSPK